MKRTVLALLLVLLLVALSAKPVQAHEYDRNDSDYFLRQGAYLLHPVGVVLEYTITRPIHKLVMIPGLDYLFGHERGPKPKQVETVVAQVTLPEMPREPLPDLEEEAIEVETTAAGVEFTLIGGVFFESGSDRLTAEGRQALDNLAEILEAQYADREIRFEGHTDNQPIQHSVWKSNWELGAARALAVLHYLVDEHGLDETKISATTFGEFRPETTNDTPANKSQNRRSVIFIPSEE